MNNELSRIILDIPDTNAESLTYFPGMEGTSEVTPRDKLKFAKQILVWIALLFILSFIMSALGFSAIFELCKEILPPIATLVIGYYFGAVK